VSKARAIARAEREAAAARRRAEAQARRERDVAERTRRERRELTWRRVRLWQHGPAFRRHKEAWAALATLILVILLLSYLFTSSLGAVLFVALVLLIASPALVMLFLDRSRK
jgi:Flp pilus assembly protein TadB